MRRSDTFIKAYNELRDLLMHKNGMTINHSLAKLLTAEKRHSWFVQQNYDFLMEMGELRNMIAHYKDYPEVTIVDPSQEILERFVAAVERIKSPKTVFQEYSDDVRIFQPNEPLASALTEMNDRDYSQVVVKINGKYMLLTWDGIAKWLSISAQKDSVNIGGVTIQEVYEHEERIEMEYLSRDDTVDKAILTFESPISKKRPRLPAILITHSGKPTEKPLGIITPWDLIGCSDLNGS